VVTLESGTLGYCAASSG